MPFIVFFSSNGEANMIFGFLVEEHKRRGGQFSKEGGANHIA